MNNEYEELTDSEIDAYLNDMHYSLLMENIYTQIQYPFSNKNVNFLKTYDDRYRFLKNLLEDSDTLRMIEDERANTYNRLLIDIENYFGFTVDRDEIDIISVTKVLYDFFIFSYNINIERFMERYIIKNKKSIGLHLYDRRRSRDVSTIAAKKVFKDLNDALILSNMGDVINEMIPSLELDEDFLKFIVDFYDDSTYMEISKLFLKSDIVSYDDNLYENFIKPIRNKEDGYTISINNVQRRLFSHFGMNLKVENDITTIVE